MRVFKYLSWRLVFEATLYLVILYGAYYLAATFIEQHNTVSYSQPVAGVTVTGSKYPLYEDANGYYIRMAIHHCFTLPWGGTRCNRPMVDVRISQQDVDKLLNKTW